VQADIGTAAVIVGVIAVGALLPMYAKWRAMQALVDRLERHALARQRRERAHADGADALHERVKDSGEHGRSR
jgi:hypothetical protein